MNKKNTNINLIESCIKKFLALMIAAGIFFTGCSDGGSGAGSIEDDSRSVASLLEDGSKSLEASDNGNLEVHFIDVGQGSATLIESDGHYMLIDGGDSKYASRLVSYLQDESVNKLDYVIATHYDADHLNGIVGALNSYDADTVIAPDYKAESKVYKSFRSLIKEKNMDITYPVTGTEYKIGDAEFTILAPNDTHYDDANDYSVAIKLVNGENSFIMTGDAEIESEYEMIETGIDLSCDVYLAGHHGSKYSSSQAFMQAMHPESVVISAGKDNKYGHPSEEALARFNAMGCNIYRTDELGDMVAISDGKNITFNTAQSSSSNISKSKNNSKTNTSQTSEANFIGNAISKKYHLPDCGSLPDKENQVYFSTIKEAEKAGYTPCGNCDPDN